MVSNYKYTANSAYFEAFLVSVRSVEFGDSYEASKTSKIRLGQIVFKVESIYFNTYFEF